MKFTQEKYNELSARIDAGEFLVAKPGDDVKAAIDAANAKGLADMANAVIADFDHKLANDFEEYKQTAEGRIKKLRDDLAEAREISDNALKRCDDLSAKVEILDRKKTEYEQLYQNLRVSVLASEDTLEQEALAKMAFMMINNGIAYLVNINKVKEEQAAFGEKVLKHLLDGNCKMAIGDQNDDKLRSAISRISDKREAALDEKNELLENRARAAAQHAMVHNEIKQVVVGDGKFLENPSAGDITKFLEEE